ncbi:MAG: hypothetical protein EA402_04895 [Planctomycetota bacterium]|nr:MAG: hypothetical protein EA402_04895 [Planctomycetota bacterium]
MKPIALLLAFTLSLVLCGLEAEEHAYPSILSWDGSSISSQQAEDWLSASGNPTTIKHASPQQQPFSFASGTYWQAVLAITQAFDLSIEEAPQHFRIHGQTRAAGFDIPNVGLGPLVLVPRGDKTAHPRIAIGPFLFTVPTAALTSSPMSGSMEADIIYYLRAEPRLPGEQIHHVILRWEPLQLGQENLSWQPELGPEPSFLSRPQGTRQLRGAMIGGPPASIHLSARGQQVQAKDLYVQGMLQALLVRAHESRFTISEFGDHQLPNAAAEESWRISLHAEQHVQQGRHRLTMNIPADSQSQGGINLQLEDQHGQRIETQGQSSRWSADGSQTFTFFYSADQQLPVTIRLTVSLAKERLQLPLKLEIEFP